MPPPSNLGPGDWLSFVTSLLLVFGLMAGLYYLTKRIRPGGVGKSAKMDIEVLETFHIGNRQRIVLLRAKDREVLLGITLQGISTLSTWTKEELAPQHFIANSDEAPPSASTDESSLRQWFKNISMRAAEKK